MAFLPKKMTPSAELLEGWRTMRRWVQAIAVITMVVYLVRTGLAVSPLVNMEEVEMEDGHFRPGEVAGVLKLLALLAMVGSAGLLLGGVSSGTTLFMTPYQVVAVVVFAWDALDVALLVWANFTDDVSHVLEFVVAPLLLVQLYSVLLVQRYKRQVTSGDKSSTSEGAETHSNPVDVESPPQQEVPQRY